MQVLCGLQVVFFLFNCQTPEHLLQPADLTKKLYELEREYEKNTRYA